MNDPIKESVRESTCHALRLFKQMVEEGEEWSVDMKLCMSIIQAGYEYFESTKETENADEKGS